MGNTSWDTDAMLNNVIPPCGTCNSSLSEAASIIFSIEIPSDFGCGGLLRGVAVSLSGISADIDRIKEWIITQINKLIDAENRNQDLANALVNASLVDIPFWNNGLNAADMANTGAAVLKGVANVLESLLDAFIIYGTTVADSGSMATGEFVPYEGGKGGISKEAWKDVMGFVANDYVESGYRNFYENTDAGQWLDENANEPFKSTGTGTAIAAGVGEVIGTAALATVTGGGNVGMAAAAGVTGFGKYTEEYWENARENAVEGEEWATEETLNNGRAYGLANGVWEGAQWYVGGKLNNLTIDGVSKVGNAAIRVGADTAFNALDTPYRTIVDVTTSDKTLKQAWEDQGGWTSVLTNAGIGLVGSIGGEIIDVDVIKNKVDVIKTNDINKHVANLYDVNNSDGSILKMAKALEDSTDVSYDKVKFRKHQYELFEELRKEMSDKEASLVVGSVFEQVINDRGGFIEIDNIDGVKIKAINDIELVNTENYKKIKKFIDNAPEKLKEGVKEIHISDVYNPLDPYWSVEYNMERFMSAATADKGVINIYAEDIGEDTLWHESGHTLDPNRQISNGFDWGMAVSNDLRVNPGRDEGVTPYATQAINNSATYAEDFADSIALYFLDRENFKKNNPNRYQFLENMFNNN